LTAPQEVVELVERFERNLDQYRSQNYNETQLRREFLDPFFEALGWDVNNRQGYAEAYKDVVHEDSIRIDEQAKAPDYSFRIGGQRMFFLEAKKPFVNIKTDLAPSYQVRRYGWSAKLSISILSDFEELALYDTRVKPLPTDKASTARVAFWTYRDYIDKWDEIAGIFSREAVLKGSFDRYAADSKRKKGTAEVDQAFLKEIESWRESLARNIALRNPNLSTRDLNFAVQRTIDRIIFLRICEARGIEDEGGLREVASHSDVYESLVQVFERADDRYNSGIFHFKREKGRADDSLDTLTSGLKIDDKVLKDILKSLYYPVCPYEFSVLPADILGQVYEQFLGKVIRLTAGHQARVEEKPEVRKAGGVYYTPSYVVDYIVHQTVGQLLKNRTPKTASKMRVVDPACGSGSFLIVAYQHLLDWHLDWYLSDGPEKHTKRMFQGRHGEWRLTTGERKRILLNSIWGVDIDRQAVEVTKLSLALKVLEGETAETLGQTRQLLADRVLPDLDSNIKCGNSLIAPDYFATQESLFLAEEEFESVNAFDWNAEFSTITAEGGFDAVIGNPPYVRIQRIAHSEADYLFQHYETLTSKADLSLAFLQKSLELTSKAGRVGMISTTQWLSTEYGRLLRERLGHGLMHELIDFGSLPVFDGADTYPGIFILSNQRVEALSYALIEDPSQLNLAGIESAERKRIPFDNLDAGSWILSGADLPMLLAAAGIEFLPLSAYVDVRIGDLTGMDAAFVLDCEVAVQLEIEQGIMMPYAYRGSEVSRFSPVVPGSMVIYPYFEGEDGRPMLLEEDIFRERFPHAYGHLLSFKDRLVSRLDSRKLYATGSDWYRHLRPGSFDYIKPRKLLIKGVALESTAGLLEAGVVFNGANCPALLLKDEGVASLSAILGLLNSSVASDYLRTVCPAKLGGYSRFNAKAVGRLPVPIELVHDAALVSLAEQLVSCSARLLASVGSQDHTVLKRKFAILEQALDSRVAEMYGFSAAES